MIIDTGLVSKGKYRRNHLRTICWQRNWVVIQNFNLKEIMKYQKKKKPVIVFMLTPFLFLRMQTINLLSRNRAVNWTLVGHDLYYGISMQAFSKKKKKDVWIQLLIFGSLCKHSAWLLSNALLYFLQKIWWSSPLWKDLHGTLNKKCLSM